MSLDGDVKPLVTVQVSGLSWMSLTWTEDRTISVMPASLTDSVSLAVCHRACTIKGCTWFGRSAYQRLQHNKLQLSFSS